LRKSEKNVRGNNVSVTNVVNEKDDVKKKKIENVGNVKEGVKKR